MLLAACNETSGNFGFSITSVALTPQFRKVDASFNQELVLSRKAVQALNHGVPLTIQLQMELRDSSTLTLLAADSRRFEIRYLPLSRHYQLTGPADTRTFPRLRHALSALSSVGLTLNTGALAPGHYEFRARARLENSRLPAPMRLPALFSTSWQHDSEWSTWPFEIKV